MYFILFSHYTHIVFVCVSVRVCVRACVRGHKMNPKTRIPKCSISNMTQSV